MNCRVSYPDITNAGDLLNKCIIHDIFGLDVIRTNRYQADLLAIGSALGNYQKADNFKERVIQLLSPKKKIYIWGSGFIDYPKGRESAFYSKGITFCAVRGQLSKQRVERILGHEITIPTGDGGILASQLINNKPKKRHKVGVIPHFREQDEEIYQTMLNFYNDGIFIDIKRDPLSVIEEIASCEYVVSGSLHGLIIADSFGIPNLHVKVSNKMRGDGFKFDDYYSGYGIDHTVFYPNDSSIPTISQIESNYGITSCMVEEKKRIMIEAFPKELLK